MKKLQLLILFLLFTSFSCSKEENEGLGSSVSEIIAEAVHPLETDEDLDILINEVGDARIVLLGEASHGTSEFYTWRARISKRLIKEKGFKIMAVEGNWTDAYQINNYIRGNSHYSAARTALREEFDEWPTWMWANEETADLAEWLRTHNTGKAANEQTGFYGLDVYSLWESMEEVLDYLEKTDPPAAETARKALDCFAPFNKDVNAYAIAAYKSPESSCADELEKLLKAVQETIAAQPAENNASWNILQNAIVAVNAENYYRTAAINNGLSWNIRDRHMTATINRLLEQHEPDSKIIVWEHNTHVGDARATDMADSGVENVGQLVREQYGNENVYIVGFGTYSGTVVAAQNWGSTRQIMKVPNAKPDSWEAMLHKIAPPDKVILMSPISQQPRFQKRIGHRAIGVVYNPALETGNYVPSVVPERYDAFIFIDKTKALTPLQ